MERIPLISSDPDLPGRIETITARCRFEAPAVLPIGDFDEAVDYLSTELPALLKGMAPKRFEPGEFVFHEGEAGNFLYFIAKGRYAVLVGNREVSFLSPDDIFLGEMSFLLKNRRSASVRATTPGKLIEISKRDFVRAIKAQPHYALLLSRLLAQRIERANLQSRLS